VDSGLWTLGYGLWATMGQLCWAGCSLPGGHVRGLLGCGVVSGAGLSLSAPGSVQSCSGLPAQHSSAFRTVLDRLRCSLTRRLLFSLRTLSTDPPPSVLSTPCHLSHVQARTETFIHGSADVSPRSSLPPSPSAHLSSPSRRASTSPPESPRFSRDAPASRRTWAAA
jgi:hypothetical protein